SKTGINSGLLSGSVYQYFLSVSLLTMAFTPFVIEYFHVIANKISSKLAPAQEPPAETAAQIEQNDEMHHLEDHIVIIGYGINGRNVAKAARHAGIPYVIIELNAVTVREERHHGEPILYGDAVHGTILSLVNIHKARVVVVAISDPEATGRIISSIREISDKVHIIVRTRFVQEMEESFRIGADEVIPEEFETSIEIFTRVLSKYLMPRDEIEAFTNSIRADNYDMLRGIAKRKNPTRNIVTDLPDLEVASLRIYTKDDSLVDKPLVEADVRNRFGVTVVAIKRDGQNIMEINARTKLTRGDVIYVVGRPTDVMRFNNFVRAD
ncbi:potassium transporter KefB, partial [Pontibacter sp. HJ8]